MANEITPEVRESLDQIAANLSTLLPKVGVEGSMGEFVEQFVQRIATDYRHSQIPADSVAAIKAFQATLDVMVEKPSYVTRQDVVRTAQTLGGRVTGKGWDFTSRIQYGGLILNMLPNHQSAAVSEAASLAPSEAVPPQTPPSTGATSGISQVNPKPESKMTAIEEGLKTLMPDAGAEIDSFMAAARTGYQNSTNPIASDIALDGFSQVVANTVASARGQPLAGAESGQLLQSAANFGGGIGGFAIDSEAQTKFSNLFSAALQAQGLSQAPATSPDLGRQESSGRDQPADRRERDRASKHRHQLAEMRKGHTANDNGHTHKPNLHFSKDEKTALQALVKEVKSGNLVKDVVHKGQQILVQHHLSVGKQGIDDKVGWQTKKSLNRALHVKEGQKIAASPTPTVLQKVVAHQPPSASKNPTYAARTPGGPGGMSGPTYT